MSAGHLLTAFDDVVDTPRAVQRLRRFILDLAVRGRLVPQDPGDEPASVLLERIAEKKDRLVMCGKIKRQKLISALHPESEQLIDLPLGWSNTRLAVVCVCLDHMRQPINAAERARRTHGKSQSELYPYFGATQQQGWIDDYIFDEELVLLGEDGAPFFDPLRPKAYIIDGKSWVNNHAHVFRGVFVSHLYLVHWLNTFDYSGRVVGATRAKLNQSRALDIPVMLPPLSEQQRIVDKVDQLMALCNRLEASLSARAGPAPTPARRVAECDPDVNFIQRGCGRIGGALIGRTFRGDCAPRFKAVIVDGRRDRPSAYRVVAMADGIRKRLTQSGRRVERFIHSFETIGLDASGDGKVFTKGVFRNPGGKGGSRGDTDGVEIEAAEMKVDGVAESFAVAEPAR